MSWSGGMGLGLGLAGFLIFLLWIAAIVLLVALVRRRGIRRGKEAAVDNLKQRFALGKISRDEFERMKEKIKE